MTFLDDEDDDLDLLDGLDDIETIKTQLRIRPMKKAGISACEVVPQKVEWLWENRIPAAKWCMIVGEESVGKSFFGAFLAAHITTGKDWPDGAKCPTGGVVIVSPEDNAADTIVPRLIDAGADLSKVGIIETAMDETAKVKNKGTVPFSIPEHLDTLVDAIRYYDAELVILDTLEMSTNINLNHSSIKELFMRPILKLCKEMGVTVLGINHPKTGAYNPDNIRSKIFGNPVLNKTSRLTYYCAVDQNNKSIITLKEIKRNLPGKCEPFTYRIVSNLKGQVFAEAAVGENIDDVEKDAALRLSFVKRQILMCLKYYNVPMKPKEVAQRTEISHETIKGTMRRLFDEGIIEQSGYGMYCLKGASPDPLAPITQQAPIPIADKDTVIIAPPAVEDKNTVLMASQVVDVILP